MPDTMLPIVLVAIPLLVGGIFVVPELVALRRAARRAAAPQPSVTRVAEDLCKP